MIKGIDSNPIAIANGDGYTYDSENNSVIFTGISEDCDKSYGFNQNVTIGQTAIEFSGSVTQKVKYNKQEEAMNKGAYYISDGLVLNGVVNTSKDIPQNIEKYIEVKNADGKVLLNKKIYNVNWYGNAYAGFQAILDSSDLATIGNVENATISIKVNYEDGAKEYAFKSTNSGKEAPTDVLIPPGAGWESPIYKDINEMPACQFGSDTVKLTLDKDNKVNLTNNIK